MHAADALIAWFERNARPLPWRGEPRDPYRSLVSEFMLQQTQVSRVVDRFSAFVEHYPTLQSLAAAKEEDVLALWSGLGYYRRARMLLRLARVVCEEHSGVLPAEAEELQSLPGVGEYTAAAVASMVFGRAVAVVDGNIRRVGARVLAFGGDSRSTVATRIFQEWVREMMEDRPPGIVNEALMELGATVCSPIDPTCPVCPFANSCKARIEGRTEQIPAPRVVRGTHRLRWVAACCVRKDGRWLVRQVNSGPILRGLWLPPFAELTDDVDPSDKAMKMLPPRVGMAVAVHPGVQHTITHRRIQVIPVRFEVNTLNADAAVWRWTRPEAPDLATSSLLEKLWKSLHRA